MAINRTTAIPEDGVILFIVGMRINKIWAIHKWIPVMIAMPRMLVEQIKNREIGVIGTPRTFVSGRLIQVQQYWKNYDLLEKYAKDPNSNHLPAWRAFNKAARKNNSVGIYHETYLIKRGANENIYGNLPSPILLGSAVGVKEVTSINDSSRLRMDFEEK